MPIVFLIGMPRSGTKLLRGILNQSKEISFPEIETECLPFWYSKFMHLDLDNFSDFQKFYGEAVKGTYFRHKKLRNESILNCEDWFKKMSALDLKKPSVARAFESLVRIETGDLEGELVGDKSPSYINAIPIIKELFPESKIIFITRDVRDYCLSIRKAWNKNIFRAAQRWNDSTESALNSLSSYPGDSCTVKYENLIENPEITMIEVCKFLNITYSDTMLKLRNAPENYGDAKGSKGIVSKNFNKWQVELTEKEIEKVESIAFLAMEKLNYHRKYNVEYTKIPYLKLFLYKLLDGYNLLFYRSEEGQSLVWKFRFHIRQALNKI